MKREWSAAPLAAKALLIFLLAAASQLTLAQDMPRFDVEAHCEDVAEITGGSHQIFNSCIQMEQGAYNGLKNRWANLSRRIQIHCQDVAKVTGGSYQILQSCVQMEEDAAGNRQSFSFD